MLARLHLVRHGEVENPNHLVYSDLPGFGLSALGSRQAAATARRLAAESVDLVVSSPLDRAVATAAPIAAAHDLVSATDERLTEWRLAHRWAGVCWDDLPDRFPGELEAYLDDPRHLRFTTETIDAVALRMLEVVAGLGVEHPGGVAVVVSHQDPIQAVRLAMTGRGLDHLRQDLPTHACVITLDHDGTRWVETTSWAPDIAS